jgi:transcriptional regulator with XRE-family HTH domain
VSGARQKKLLERSDESFVTALPRLLAERNVSLREVSRESGVSVSHISRVLRGQRAPTGEVAAAVAKALGLADDYFPEYRLDAVTEAMIGDPALRDRLYDDLRKA